MLTAVEIFEEYAKCLDSPIYAIESYLQTFDKTQEGFVPFKLFVRQKEIVRAYEKHRFNLVTKPRQAGISTTTQAYCSIKIGFADPKNPETIIVIANKLTLAKKFLKGIKDYVNQLPRWVWGNEYYGSEEKHKKSIFVKDSQIEVELPNGSKIIAVATSEDALRGYTPTFLIFDEAAFIDRGADLYAAAVTSLGTGGRAILISTPNGYDPLYYKTYEQALRKDNTYNVIELKWYEDPRYNKDLSWLKGDEVVNEFEFTLDSYKKKIKEGYKPTSTWYSDMCKNMNNDKKKIAQELDVSFLGSGGNVIDDEFIEFHEKNNVTEPKYIDKSYYDGNSGLIWVWSEPIEGHEYIMAADVARGDGADYSCFQIIDFTTMEQVVEYQGKIPPDNFAEVLSIYGLKYDAFLIVDNIGVGNTTTTKLVELKYPNLYYEEKTKDNKVAGFNINGCRLQLISNLEIAIRTNTIKINSIRLIHEMKTFIYKNGRPDHMEGYHDDCLKKGTLIKTIEGYKPIENIKVGDLVLTHLGRYKEVEACLEKPFNGEWYDFKFQGMLNLGLSYNHPLYSAPNTWKDSDSNDYNKREWVLPNEWDKNKNGSIRKQTNRGRRQISIKENLPKNNNIVLYYDDFRVKHPNETNIGLNKITLDNNFAKFLGLFLADGCAPTIEKEYSGNKYYTMSIAFHIKDEALCVEMSEYLKSININSYRTKVKGNGFALIFSSKFLSGLLSYCYNNDHEKILPYYAYNLGQDLTLVLDYWIKGDGWIDNKHGYDFIAASTSKQLALSMMDIAWSCGKYATISLHTRHRYDVKTKDQYWVNIRNEFKDGDRLKLLSNFEYGNKTVKINKTIYNGTVYNLQVKDDESFIADGIVVHNCLMSLGMALWILESSFKSLKKSKEQTKAILSSWIVGGTDSSTSTITTIDPISNKKTTRINPNHSAYRNVQDPNGEYMWLFSGMR